MSQSYAKTGGHWPPCARKDEAAWRLAIVIRDGFACVYCGTDLKNAKPKVITLDHLDPSSQDGSNEPHNLVTACRPCNSSRQDRPWREFAPGGSILRIEQLVATPTNIELARAFIAGRI